MEKNCNAKDTPPPPCPVETSRTLKCWTAAARSEQSVTCRDRDCYIDSRFQTLTQQQGAIHLHLMTKWRNAGWVPTSVFCILSSSPSRAFVSDSTKYLRRKWSGHDLLMMQHVLYPVRSDFYVFIVLHDDGCMMLFCRSLIPPAHTFIMLLSGHSKRGPHPPRWDQMCRAVVSQHFTRLRKKVFCPLLVRYLIFFMLLFFFSGFMMFSPPAFLFVSPL